MNNDLALTFVIIGGLVFTVVAIVTAASNNFQACLDAAVTGLEIHC